MSAPPHVRRATRRLPLRGTSVLLAAAIASVGAAYAAALPLGVWCVVLLPVAAVVFGDWMRAATVAGALLYTGVLSWSYENYFVDLFAYQGMVDATPDANAVLVAMTLAAVPALWLPLSAARPSTTVLWSLYIVGYVPAIVIPIFLTGRLDAVLPLDAALLGAMAILGCAVRLPSVPPIAHRHLSLETFTHVLVVLSVVGSVYVLVIYGLHPPPSLSDVYAIRSEVPAADQWTAGYVITWSGNVFNPLLLALGLARRRMLLVLIAISGQVILYSDTGLKSILFSIAIVPLFYGALSVTRKFFGLLVVFATSVVFAVALAVTTVTSDWSVTLLRRQFAVPGQQNWNYFEYFSSHAHYHLSATRLGFFFSSPYTLDPATLIGQVYFPPGGTNANAGIWADAFANFGYYGIIVFTLILCLVLWVLDGIGHSRDIRVIGPTLAIAGLTLSETGLLTTLLTLGLGITCALLVVMPPGSIGRSSQPHQGIRRASDGGGGRGEIHARKVPGSYARRAKSDGTA